MSKLNHQNIIDPDSGQDLPRGMGDNGGLTIEYVPAASLKADRLRYVAKLMREDVIDGRYPTALTLPAER